MPKTGKKTGKERLDKYYHLAKEQGFRSRAAFKLIQLNKKYDFLTSAKCVIDLCAAPGGWLQVARKYQPVAGLTIGVDLANIKNIPGVITFQGDITLPKTMQRIKQECKGAKADVVLNDGAPNVGANWFRDAFTQSELVMYSLRIAATTLRAGGWFITKVFRSKDYTALVWLLGQFFNKVEATKPKASRNASAEIYLVGIGYKAPKDIDPKMFDPKHVFEEVAEKKTLKKISPKELLKKRNRNREGYEDDAYVLFKKTTVSDFVEQGQPINILAEYNVLEFDKSSEKYFTHPATSTEVKKLCEDLKVLGMADFKLLLKWRIAMKKWNDELNGVAPMEDDENAEMADEDVDAEVPEKKADNLPTDEKEIRQELDELRAKSAKVRKNIVKREKKKAAKRPPLPSDLTEKADDIMDNVSKGQMFTLTSLNDREAVESAMQEPKAVNDYDDYVDSEDELDKTKKKAEIPINPDDYSSEEELYDDVVEHQIDRIYDQYLEIKSKRQRQGMTRRAMALSKEKEDLYDAKQEEQDEFQKKYQYEKSANPLIASFDDPQDSKKTKQWFSQNVFGMLKDSEDMQDANNDDDDDDVKQPARKRVRTEKGAIDASKVMTQYRNNNDDDDDDDDDSSDDDDYNNDKGDESDEDVYEQIKQKLKGATIDTNEDIETVPQEMHDEETRATTLALAKKMLDKKQRREFIDGAYHRYAFNDDNLPEWFEKDEQDAFQKQLPISKEEVEAQKARFKAIDEKPIKKELEAQMRKKRKAMHRMQKLRERANVIAESNDLSNTDKARQLSKLYSRAKTKKIKPVFVVSQKPGGTKGGERAPRHAPVKVVDPRSKKERRAQKAQDRKRKRK